MNKRPINLSRYVASFAISLLIFWVGFSVSNRINQAKLNELKQNIDALQSEYNSLEMLTLIDKTARVGCEMYEEQIINFGNETDSFGSKLAAVSERLSSDNPELINMQTNYWLMEIRDFYILKQIEDKCSQKYQTILYFYDRDCANCQFQGELLRQLKADYPEVMIYSFDVSNKDISIIKILSQIYQISQTPTFIIDGEKIEKGLTRTDLEKTLGLKARPIRPAAGD
jgi:thiol-disulfide isomerase/thioredoxin